MDFHIDISNSVNGLARASDKFHRGIELYGQTAALKMEAYAKQNRPWTDRTSNAKNTLKGISGWGYINVDISKRKTGQSNEYGNKVEISSINNPNKYGYGDIFTVGITGNMYYSVYLELCHGQKYAVLWPTVNALSAEVIKGWAAMLSKLK